jgi:hypothetical protein
LDTKFAYSERGDYNGDEVAWLYAAARSNNAYGANLRWASDNELLVEYLRARKEKLEKSIIYVAGRDVRIALLRTSRRSQLGEGFASCRACGACMARGGGGR